MRSSAAWYADMLAREERVPVALAAGCSLGRMSGFATPAVVAVLAIINAEVGLFGGPR